VIQDFSVCDREVMPQILDRLASDVALDRAFAWLCEQRRRWPDTADIWSFRRDWSVEKARLQTELRGGRFRFSLQERVTRGNGEVIDLWSARDALVLKALAEVLGDLLPISRSCVHVKGHGGAKAAVREIMRQLPSARFVLKTDVASYYASIDPVKLLDRLAAVVADPDVLNLVAQMIYRVSERGGLYTEFRRGIPLGCPLSPLLGAFFLGELDTRLEATGLFFVRFMDDVIVLAPTRHKLRRAVKIVNETFDELALAKHPDKTFIGRVERGFDFLGYHLTPGRLTLSRATVERFDERAHRLYAHQRGKPPGFPRLGAYVRRWQGWTTAGLRTTDSGLL
jgi:RNA-directed DNA polymerase